MIDETLYQQYAKWLDEKQYLVSFLKEKDSVVYFRLSHIFDILEYLYDSLIDNPDYSEDEDVIFQMAFSYLASQVAKIEEVLNNNFNGDLNKIDEAGIGINLMLNVCDMGQEVELFEVKDPELEAKFHEFSQEILNMVVNNQEIDQNVHLKFESLIERAFDQSEDIEPIIQILLKIAEEFDLI